MGNSVSLLMLRFSRAALLVAAVFTADAVRAEQISVSHEPILLNLSDPTMTRVGRLVYRGGLLLSSTDKNFGGFSALHIHDEGRRLTSISDRGYWLTADLSYNADVQLSGLTNASMTRMKGLDGRPLKSKKHSDAEAIASNTDGGIHVSFERNHRVWLYSAVGSAPVALSPPRGIKHLKKNSGIEALTRLSGDRLLALAEGSKNNTLASGWIGNNKGWLSLSYQLSDGFRVTGAATHPSGDVFVLERFYSLTQGAAVRVVRITDREIKAGSTLTGTLVAEIRPPLSVDNFEGIDLRVTKDNRTFVYLISDDNFNFLQATLLIMFEVLAK